MNKFLGIVTAGILLASANYANAASRVGIVESSTGSIEQKYTSSSEISSNTKIELQANDTLTFVHYSSCTEVSMVGGTVEIGTIEYKITGGTYVENQLACPERIQVESTTSTTGGLVLRGPVGSVNVIGITPKVLLSGKHANLITDVKFIGINPPIIGSVENSHIILNNGTVLPVGDYKMVLLGKDVKLTIPVSVKSGELAPVMVIAVN